MVSEWRDMEIDGREHRTMPIRVYDSPDRGKTPPLVLYFGGGSFLDRDRNGESPIARCFAASGAVVVEADYADPSGNAFPKALEYGFAGLRCLAGKRKQFGGGRSLVLVAGEEAGGNVAAAVALKARDQMPDEIDGQILLSPMIDPLMATASFREASALGMLDRWTEGWNHYLGSGGGCCHPYAAPGHCSRLTGIAPAMVVTSEDDPLRDEASSYATRLAAAGGKVKKTVLPAASGWTRIYDAEATAKWEAPEALRSEFQSFVQGLENRTFCF